MASHAGLGSPSAESKQPYKVARQRFNPKFISSISKSLSRSLGIGREPDEDDADLPSLHRLCRLVLAFPSVRFLLSAPATLPRLISPCTSHPVTLAASPFGLPSRGPIGMLVGAS